MAILNQSSTYNRSFLMVSTADHITGSTGLTCAVTLGKAGSTTFVTSTGVITEQVNGWYNIGMTTTDTNTVGELTIHASATGADPTDWTDQVNPSIPSNIKKNFATNGFTFVMTDATTHAPKTGVTVSATRSLDGAAFGATTNSPTEVATGTYTINLSTADTNGNHIMYRFTGTGADDLNLSVHTQP
jgi:hypothetical protein